MLGRLLYQFRTKYGKGLRVAYYRDWVRPRILNTAPIATDTDGACEIHVLTSQYDWLNLVWTLKTFYWMSGRGYPLCIHDDGSLSTDHQSHLRRHFPAARLIPRDEADREAQAQLADYPRCRAFRESNQLAPKIFDFARHLRAPRMLLLDSDVVFFAAPAELLRRAECQEYRQNTVNRDVSSAYTVSPDDVLAACGFPLLERFNSGLGVLHRESLRLDWFEEFLGLPGIIGHMWRIEQTLLALASCRFGCELLPDEYDVYLTPGLGERPSRHYVGAIRHLMYSEAMSKVLAQEAARFATASV